MEWYNNLFEVIDMRSFSNLWYWIMLAVQWSVASHWVLGVPFDLVRRARGDGAAAQEDLELLVRINCTRLLSMTRRSGHWILAFTAFIITSLLLMATVYEAEFAQAVLFLFVPMVVLFGLSIRAARLIEAGEGNGAALHRRLNRHRIATQALGMVSIFVTSLFGMYQNMHIGVLG